MGKYSFYDVFFAAALILAVADGNVFTFLLLVIASVLELADVAKGILEWENHSKGA